MNKKIYADLLNNRIKFYSYNDDLKNENYNLNNSLILSGSFNPLHEGHIELLKASSKEFKKNPLFEISIKNVDKSEINFNDLMDRINQFRSLGKLVVTNSEKFEEKSKIFKESIFVIGYDTALRLVDNKYYNDDFRRSLKIIEKNNCSFLVSGRFINKKYKKPNNINFEGYDYLFNILSEEKFRIDISSTELRRLR
tara:strand:+ start:1526 stop:2113 length:588 start_codon:yes stop_codon:yes gene_type:complete